MLQQRNHFANGLKNIHTFTEYESKVVQGGLPTVHLRTDDVT